ncbi:hypothetical protein GCM10019016_093570 [Streptomyces prasinosporus]|uniref:Uncharacterized protein n=1 Tax=Streptomyces prasinosporus TaxID=68256 RepID=A0ABP6U6I6_9ACTN
MAVQAVAVTAVRATTAKTAAVRMRWADMRMTPRRVAGGHPPFAIDRNERGENRTGVGKEG